MEDADDRRSVHVQERDQGGRQKRGDETSGDGMVVEEVGEGRKVLLERLEGEETDEDRYGQNLDVVEG